MVKSLTPKHKKEDFSKPTKNLSELVKRPLFQKLYAIGSVLILVATTIYWSLLGASVQRSNADQLVNPYLFDHPGGLSKALFPGQHTYLLKWPLFYIVHLLHETTSSYFAMTLLVCLATVLAFTYIIHKIEPRPVYFGTIVLLFASVLMLIPAQPYAGGLLPVNMAMVATRNIEYIIYIFVLYLVVRARSLRTKQFVLAVLLLALLIASDKLFLSISIAGSVIVLIIYGLRQKWQFVTIALHWLVMTALAAGMAIITLTLFGIAHITHTVGQGTNPYGYTDSLAYGARAVIYGVLSVFTNFGANPGLNTIYPKSLPHSVTSNFFSSAGPAFLINAALLLAGIAVVWQIARQSLSKGKKNLKVDEHYRVTVMLLATGLAALLAYLVTNHFYPVDARYITILLFGVFMSLAVYSRSRKWSLAPMVLVGFIVTAAMFCTLPLIRQIHHDERVATADVESRNLLITQALLSHPVSTLVGDYWRVVPIKQISRGQVGVTPLENCTSARSVLSSLSWQPNLEKNSFAYLLSSDKSLTDFPSCSLGTILATYGKPNLSVLIKGTLDNPTERLLFYDHGIHKSSPTTPGVASTVTSPINVSDLPNTFCPTPTIMNIVAHEDDDILFMNPSIYNDIKAGRCVRTVYITAGDSGSGSFYWLGREQGSEAAYNTMLGLDNIWIQRTIKLSKGQFVTVANPKGNTKISLIFMHLPDGNLTGQGFGSSHNQSLQKLYDGKIQNIDTVYGGSAYTSDDLVGALEELMYLYQPAEIRTQSTIAGTRFQDHSDHLSVSRFVGRAYSKYETDQFNNEVVIPLKHYMGYPIHEHGVNIGGDDLSRKIEIFLNYAKHDGSVCQTSALCLKNQAYGAYLPRQYEAGQ